MSVAKSVLNEWQESVMRNIEQNLRNKGFDEKTIVEITEYPIVTKRFSINSFFKYFPKHLLPIHSMNFIKTLK